MAVSIFVVVVVNYAYLLNAFEYGFSDTRNLAALEVYALKLPELFLPAGYSKIPYFNELAYEGYYKRAYIRGEVWSPYFGVAGILCCIFFIVNQSYNGIKNPVTLVNPPLLQAIWVTLFSLVGGINLVLGTIGFQGIRATNRYSIWLLAVILLYTLFKLTDVSIRNIRWKKIIEVGVLSASLCFVWLDLPIKYDKNSREAVASQVREDIKLIETLQRDREGEVSVYVIPNQVFPENGPTEQMIDYDHLRIFLNSSNVKINYGGVKTSRVTPIALFNYRDNLEAFLEKLAFYKFDYLVINHKGVSKIEYVILTERLKQLIGVSEGIVSGYTIYQLPDENLRHAVDEEHLPKLDNSRIDTNNYLFSGDIAGPFSGIRSGVGYSWSGKVHALETNLDNNLRWTSGDVELHLYNASDKTKNIDINMAITNPSNNETNFKVIYPEEISTFALNAGQKEISSSLRLPTGLTTIKIQSDGTILDNGDPRNIVFGIVNFRIKESSDG